jgi:hypothetical protein
VPQPSLSTAPYAALLDACVLVPVALADTLLRVAECNLYRPLWSQRIIDEALSALHRVHPEIPAPQFVDRFDQMNAAFEDELVAGWERLENQLVLPDPNDRHVLAAAIRGSAARLTSFSKVRAVPSWRLTSSTTPRRPQPGRLGAIATRPFPGWNTSGVPRVAWVTCCHSIPAAAARPWAISPIWEISRPALRAQVRDAAGSQGHHQRLGTVCHRGERVQGER